MVKIKTENGIQFLVIDLFCGAGGTATGFEMSKKAKVIAAINHDPIAIASHYANYPHVVHFTENIKEMYTIAGKMQQLVALVDYYRKLYPKALVILWASLECTNFSNAKGGPRDADSRTLANHLFPYITAINPDYVQIENVKEFLAWGPLDENGKPISRTKGYDFVKWRDAVHDMGYVSEWKRLNSADFGAYTSRDRLFGCFAKPGLPIVWPKATHAKNPDKLRGDKLKKWQAVKHVLDFSNEGESIFNRKKQLSTKTYQRVYMGCIKHIAGGKEAFISKQYSGKPMDKNISIDGPAGTITTRDSQAAVFVTKWNSNDAKTGTNSGNSINDPLPTITTQNRLGKVTANFIDQRNGSGEDRSKSVNEPAKTLTKTGGNQNLVFISKYNGVNGGKHDNSHSVEGPIGTIPCADIMAKVQAEYFLDKQYPGAKDHQSIEVPAGTIVTNDVKTEMFISNPSWFGNPGSVENPCPVIIARQDKAPLYLVMCKRGLMSIPVYDTDCEWIIKLKEFMVLYGISDIKMRMLLVAELKLIQGFPDEYVLKGNTTDQKKFIGNSVHPLVPKAWVEEFDRIIHKNAA